MRLFLIPISSRRTLIYGQNTRKALQPPSLADKASARAARLWQSWEKGEKKWQRYITEYGNRLVNRIPFEEWGLKSIPPLSSRRHLQDVRKREVEVVFPPSILEEKSIPSVIEQLATERRGLHQRRLMWSLIGMPISAPFAIVPLIPNIPFFYLLYRAFSHWKALAGGKHLKYLVDKKLLRSSPSHALDAVYARRNMRAVVDAEVLADESRVEWKELKELVGTGRKNGAQALQEEVLLINEKDAHEIALVVDVPALVTECERATRQVADKLQQKAHKHAQGIRLEEAAEMVAEKSQQKSS